MIYKAFKSENPSVCEPAPQSRTLETRLTHYATKGCFYIGRKNAKRKLPESKWKNPFSLVDYREKALDYFEKYFLGEYDLLTYLKEYNSLNKIPGGLITQVEELRGKTLGCYCCKVGEFIGLHHPLICHGQIYLKALRGDYDYLTNPKELEPIAKFLAELESIDALHELRQTYRPRFLKESYLYGREEGILNDEKSRQIRDWTIQLNNCTAQLLESPSPQILVKPSALASLSRTNQD